MRRYNPRPPRLRLPTHTVSASLRIALVVNPFTLRAKWGEHAPELARELLGRGHTVRGFGAPPGAIPRSGPDADPGDGLGPDEPVGLMGFQPDAIVAYESSSPAAWLGARTSRRLGVPLVIVESASALPRGWSRIVQGLSGALWGRLVRGRASHVMALDAIALERARRAGFSQARTSFLPGGVDLSVYRPGLSSGLILRHHIRGRILLYVGQVTGSRGLELLASAFAKTVGQRGDWSLVFAGDGDERSHLRAKVERLGISSRVHFLPAPRDEELPGLMSSSTLLAVPAEDDTVRGRNIPRAMACGLPVLASDRATLRSLVDEDRTGLFAPAGDVEGWTEILRRASMSPDARKRWGIAARRAAEERFAWPRIAETFEQSIVAARGEITEATESELSHRAPAA